MGNKVEKAKLSARSPFDPLLCTCVRPGHLDKDRGNYLIKPKIDPGDNKPGAKHSAVGALNGSNGPEEESEPEHRERNVPVGDLAQRSPERDRHSLIKESQVDSPGEHVIWHHLLHRNTHTSKVAREAVDMHLKSSNNWRKAHWQPYLRESGFIPGIRGPHFP